MHKQPDLAHVNFLASFDLFSYFFYIGAKNQKNWLHMDYDK